MPSKPISSQSPSLFEAGIAVWNITPEPGAWLWGYSDRSGPATGTLDPLFAKAVAFRANGTTAVVVSLDLGRVPVEDSRERIRARARRAGIDFVMLSATHTHHAPVMEMDGVPYTAAIEQAIGDAIEEAVRRLQPARVGLSHAEINIGHNRRELTPDLHCRMRWRNAEKRATAPLDNEATLIKLDSLDGTPIGVLVHFACHPVVMGPSNLQYSADYPGELTRRVKEAAGAECIFLQGGCGDVNPYLDKTPINQGGVESMRATGCEAAEAVILALPSIQTAVPTDPAVAAGETIVPVGTRWDFSNAETRQTYFAAHGWLSGLVSYYERHLSPDLSVPTCAVVLNNEIALTGVPGEFFTRFQLELKATAPVRHALLCGYTNGFHLYFPTVRDAIAGGYGGTVASYVGLGSGDKVLAEAKVLIAKLSNRTSRHCRPEDFVIEDAEA